MILTSGVTTLSFKMSNQILYCPYLKQYLSYRLQIWHKTPYAPKTKLCSLAPMANHLHFQFGHQNIVYYPYLRDHLKLGENIIPCAQKAKKFTFGPQLDGDKFTFKKISGKNLFCPVSKTSKACLEPLEMV